MDVSESVGKAACSGLQQEFPPKDVLFLLADVTKKEELVMINLLCMIGQSTLNDYPFREELLRRLKKSLVILTLCATMLALVMKANGERCWKSTWYSNYDNPNV